MPMPPSSEYKKEQFEDNNFLFPISLFDINQKGLRGTVIAEASLF